MTNFNEKREHERKPYTQPIRFSVSIFNSEVRGVRRVLGNGIALDISKGGIGFITDCPLEPGHVLQFLVTGENPAIPEIGLVKWTASMGSGTRAGIQFK